jgi:hypothetical protein
VTELMTMSTDIPLVAPRVPAVLDPDFRPAVLAVNAYNALVDASGEAVPVRIALEQADGSVFRFDMRVLPESHPQAAINAFFLERLVKFILWSRGGWRIYVDGPAALADHLEAHYQKDETGRFDAHFVGELVFGHRAHQGRPAGARRHQAARPLPRRLPHRVRSGRKRSESGSGRRRTGRLQQ